MRQQLFVAALTVCLFPFYPVIFFLPNVFSCFLYRSFLFIFVRAILIGTLVNARERGKRERQCHGQCECGGQHCSGVPKCSNTSVNSECGRGRGFSFLSFFSRLATVISRLRRRTCPSSSTAFAVWQTDRTAKARYTTRAAAYHLHGSRYRRNLCFEISKYIIGVKCMLRLRFWEARDWTFKRFFLMRKKFFLSYSLFIFCINSFTWLF